MGEQLTGPRTDFVGVPQARLRVREAGDGDWTVITAPDPPNVLEHLDPLFEELTPHLNLLAYELPGFGYSRLLGTQPSLDVQTETLIELIESWVEGRCALAIPCIGGLIAHRAATRRPDLVDALVLIQTPDWHEAHNWSRRIDPMELLHKPLIGQLLNRLGRRWLTRSWYNTALGPDEDPDQYILQAKKSFDDGARFPLAQAFQTLLAEKDGDASRAPQSTLIVWGDADRSYRSDAYTSSEHLIQNEQSVQSVVLEDVGHFPDLEATDRFRNELIPFLDSIPNQTGNGTE